MKKPECTRATSSKTKVSESYAHESSSSAEGEIDQVLADVTFEELQRARSDGTDIVYRKPKVENKTGRANKNMFSFHQLLWHCMLFVIYEVYLLTNLFMMALFRPMEISSKKPVRRFREVIQVPKKVVRDLRFESLCGKLDVDGFKKRCNFIYENALPADKEKKMKKVKDPEVVEELKGQIS